MFSNFSVKRRLVLASLPVALVSAGCGLMAPKAERYIAPQAGSHWTYMNRDTGSYGSGSAQNAGRILPNRIWQGREVHAFEGAGVTSLLDQGRNARFIVQLKGETPMISWDPPLGYEWPLEVGKTWTKKTTITNHAAKRTIPLEYTQKVEAYESVTVPAGTFKAFRVRTVNSAGDENMQWFSPEAGIFVKQSLRRTASHAAGPGTREVELISYKRGN